MLHILIRLALLFCPCFPVSLTPPPLLSTNRYRTLRPPRHRMLFFTFAVCICMSSLLSLSLCIAAWSPPVILASEDDRLLIRIRIDEYSPRTSCSFPRLHCLSRTRLLRRDASRGRVEIWFRLGACWGRGTLVDLLRSHVMWRCVRTSISKRGLFVHNHFFLIGAYIHSRLSSVVASTQPVPH